VTESLRACPFCGGADIGTERHGNEYLTLCYSCVRSGSRYGKTRLEAVEIWNRRAPVALPSREEVAQLRGIAAELLALREAEGGAECEITTNARAVMAALGERREG